MRQFVHGKRMLPSHCSCSPAPVGAGRPQACIHASTAFYFFHSPQAVHLSCSIFLSMLLRVRQALKAEVAAFFPLMFLKAVEPPEPLLPGVQRNPVHASFQYKYAGHGQACSCAAYRNDWCFWDGSPALELSYWLLLGP